MASAGKWLNPMIADHPDAVFLMRTHLDSMGDEEGFEEAGYRIARAVLRAPAEPCDTSSPPIIKPNIVYGNLMDEQGRVMPTDGVVTDVRFVEGIVRFLKESGFNRITIAEGGEPNRGEDVEHTMDRIFEERGYRELADRVELDLVGLYKRTYQADDVVWRSLGDQGVVFREIPFVRPLPGDFVINVPTLKTHNLAVVSLCAKNLQGTIAVPFREHCVPFKECYPGIEGHLQPDFADRILRLSEKHDREGYWRMNIAYERYAQRTCDTILAFRPQPTINIIEGIRGRDGTGFLRGRDWLTNLVIAGVNPVHVDTIASYLMGQAPRAVVAYLRIAEERGLGTCDPFAIPTYVVEDEGTFRLCDHLSEWQMQPFLDVTAGNGSIRSRYVQL